ncbi:MAG: PAS domain S-box protein [Coleofasciculaceae cyanobacterium SM2_3_26]|nr:PAS domain S-box protein [Coleofasciculaceae cyanobacterium SM2_3_26]
MSEISFPEEVSEDAGKFPQRETDPSEVARLREQVKQLQQEKADLEAVLDIQTAHASAIEAELHALNQQLQAQIKEREQAEERYRSIFENAVEGLFQTTPDGHYLNANPALARIYGYESVAVMIEQIADLGKQIYVDPMRRQEFLDLMEVHGRVTNFESQVYRWDGSVIWIAENAHTVKDARGKVLYYEGSVVDITHRRIWEEALRYQQERAERLLLNILPAPIAEQLKLDDSTIADSFGEVTVLFADLANFTEFSARVPPRKLVALLNQIFSEFDRLAELHRLEKIKTIGDAYMVVGGLPVFRNDHARAIAQMALDMQQAIAQFDRGNGEPFQLRIGIHTGPVIAGVIGIKKFIYDLWGDTVNVASRMESQGIPGKIQVTAVTRDRLKQDFMFERRGAIEVKGKGEMVTYWLVGKQSG